MKEILRLGRYYSGMDGATRVVERLEQRPLSLSMSGDFRGRQRLPRLARQAIAELLLEANCERGDQELGIIAAQELAENLVKYSSSSASQLQVFINQPDADHIVIELRTMNDARPHEIHRILSLLSEVDRHPDTVAFYHQHIAASALRQRSELGLLRILAEAMLSLKVNEVDGRVCVEARGTLRRVDGAYPSHLDPVS